MANSFFHTTKLQKHAALGSHFPVPNPNTENSAYY